VALVTAGVETDVLGIGYHDLDPASIAAVVAAHPRPDFKRQILAAFTDGFRDRPDTTFGTVNADVLAHFLPASPEPISLRSSAPMPGRVAARSHRPSWMPGSGGCSSSVPVPPLAPNSPYWISNESYADAASLLHDVCGQPDVPVPYLDKQEADWELRTYVLCEVLAWRVCGTPSPPPGGERPRRDALLRPAVLRPLDHRGGQERWSTRGLVTVPELAAKIDEVRARRRAAS